jgi:4-amino-4-deoxy-L-arabinose transferase-like glycosyltransferase
MEDQKPSKDTAWVIGAFSLGTFLLHMGFNGRFGYFRDELYYIACGRHLDWGYVDQPPLIALLTWLERAALGDSLHALRFLPALASGLLALLTGLLTVEFGGRRYAAGLACLAAALAPAYLVNYNLMTMNAFEPLFWMACALLAVHIFNGGDPKLWLLFGLVAGIGLQNKQSMAFFAAAFLLGMLWASERRALRGPWPWAGCALALAVFLPNFLWELHRGFPTLELLQNIQRSGRNADLNGFQYIHEQVKLMGPLAAPLWIGGLWVLFFYSSGKRFRALAWTYALLLAYFILFKGKTYYLAPAYPMLFAAGAVAFQDWAERRSLGWLKMAYPALLTATACLIAPIAGFPLLSPEQTIAYTKALHLQAPRLENHPLGPFSQLYADQFGWKEMAESTAEVYHRLTPKDQARCAIFAANYGEAGAIDFFGEKMGLPQAISGHQNYYYWGPRD